ncbi:zinc knuckle CX2CX4HX4C [Artemisia annua]|uniref:Zinc knuckle CX2CX4HX4C n=1 Tax=Artemisia annua TaxID=35608 RepID=A0A2U1N2I7_ARTAN|nr:zinc knuckle CX2CX4HX4C [Artemisia annua]
MEDKSVGDNGEGVKSGDQEGISDDITKVDATDGADQFDNQCMTPMANCVVPETVNDLDNNSKFVEKSVSYAYKLNNHKEPFDNKLFQIPTVLNENGHEFVIFDEEIISEEVWCTKGLSALASKIGKPLIMGAMTSRMCNQGVGRLGFARVLVEVNACKGLEEYIDVLYKSREDGRQFVKKVKVEYDWKQPDQVEKLQKDEEGFTQANAKKVNHKKDQRNVPPQKPKEKITNPQKMYKPVAKPVEKQSVSTNNTSEHNKTTHGSQKRTWNVNDEVVQAVRNTANRYSVLES